MVASSQPIRITWAAVTVCCLDPTPIQWDRWDWGWTPAADQDLEPPGVSNVWPRLRTLVQEIRPKRLTKERTVHQKN